MNNAKIRIKLTTLLVFAILIGYYLFLHRFIRNQHAMMDERFHVEQLLRFTHGDYHLSPSLSMGPGFHFILLPFVKLFHLTTISSIRTVSLFIGCMSLIIFYWATRLVDKKNSLLKLVSFGLFPLVSYNMILLYTDIVSITLTLSSFVFIKKRWYFLSAIIAGSSLVVRQTNIIWLTYVWFIGFQDIFGAHISKINLLEYGKKTWGFIFCFLGFGIFVIVNGGIALGGKEFQPLTPSLGNVIFLVLAYVLIFLPERIIDYQLVMDWVRRNKKIFLAVFFGSFLVGTTFTNAHPWNQTTYFVRNQLATWIASSVGSKFIASIIFLYGIISFLSMRKMYWGLTSLGIFALLSIFFVWLIEPRYYLTAFTFFLLYRPIRSYKASLMMSVMHVGITFYLVKGLQMDAFFL